MRTAAGAARPRRALAATTPVRPRRPADLLETPIVSRTVTDAVVDRLVTAVALGVYVPAQSLPPERELAAMLDVSRATLRDALGRLVQDGYLEVRRGRTGGTFVRASWGPRSVAHVRRQILGRWSEFEQVFDARRLVEPLIARTAAERCTDADRAAIALALEAYGTAPDRDASRRADATLHGAIAGATRNAILVGLSLDLRARVSLSLGAEPYTPDVRRIAVGQHRELAAAVVEGRPEAAAAVAADHFLLSETLIRDLARRIREEEGRSDVGPEGRR